MANDDQLKDLKSLIRSLKRVAVTYSSYVRAHPSARMGHHSPFMLIAAWEREVGIIQAAIARAAELEAERAAHRTRREWSENDQFAADVLIRGGVIKSIDELPEWRRKQNARPGSRENFAEQMFNLELGAKVLLSTPEELDEFLKDD